MADSRIDNVNFEDYPKTTTPVSAATFNRVSKNILAINNFLGEKALETTAATVSEAINEINTKITNNSLFNTSAKTISGAINELLTKFGSYQTITDSSLTTTNKTIPTAINEINAKVTSGTTDLTAGTSTLTSDTIYVYYEE